MLYNVAEDFIFIKRIITGGWWLAKKEPKPKNPHQSLPQIKVIRIVFFDNHAVFHHKFFPQGQTVNKEHYFAVVRHLREESDRIRV